MNRRRMGTNSDLCPRWRPPNSVHSLSSSLGGLSSRYTRQCGYTKTIPVTPYHHHSHSYHRHLHQPIPTTTNFQTTTSGSQHATQPALPSRSTATLQQHGVVCSSPGGGGCSIASGHAEAPWAVQGSVTAGRGSYTDGQREGGGGGGVALQHVEGERM